ncbi:MAG: carbohydrate ABC transporter permease [Pseudomonadota bacterium]
MLVAVFAVPFFWMLATSFTANQDVFVQAGGQAWLWPEHLTWRNYVEVFTKVPMARYLANSLFTALVHSIIETAVAAGAAFVMVAVGGRWGRRLFWLLFAAWLIPHSFLILPRFLVTVGLPKWLPASEFWTATRSLDLAGGEIVLGSLLGLDSLAGIILPGCFSTTAAFLLATALRQMPRSLLESARLDSASAWRIFCDICLPGIRAPLVVVGFMAFHGAWRSFTWPLLIASSPEMLTAPVGLMAFQNLYQTQWSLLMAGGVVLTVPSLILLFIAHRQVIDQAHVYEGEAHPL